MLENGPAERAFGRGSTRTAWRGRGVLGRLLVRAAASQGNQEVRERGRGHSTAGTARRRRGHSADHGDVRAAVAVANGSSTTPATVWRDLGRAGIVEMR